MAALPIPERLSDAPWPEDGANDSLQYPHAIDHAGSILIAFSRRKRTVEVVEVPRAELDSLLAKEADESIRERR
jgi:hypothetical protein